MFLHQLFLRNLCSEPQIIEKANNVSSKRPQPSSVTLHSRSFKPPTQHHPLVLDCHIIVETTSAVFPSFSVTPLTLKGFLPLNSLLNSILTVSPDYHRSFPLVVVVAGSSMASLHSALRPYHSDGVIPIPVLVSSVKKESFS